MVNNLCCVKGIPGGGLLGSFLVSSCPTVTAKEKREREREREGGSVIERERMCVCVGGRGV